MTVAFVMAGAPAAHACKHTRRALGDANAGKVRRAAMCLVNQQRRKAGLAKLGSNDKLVAATTAHSTDMVANGYFDHNGPSGDTLITRVTLAGYLTGRESAWGLAENIAYGPGTQGSARVIVRGWMASPVHRANVLSQTAREAGVGVAKGTPDGSPDGATFTLDLGFAL